MTAHRFDAADPGITVNSSNAAPPLLDVRDLSIELTTARGPGVAVRDLSFSLGRGETLGLIGESGCGKSLTAMALMGLLPESAVIRGRVTLARRELLTMDESQWCDIRGNRIAMIFQEPMTALNPLHTVGRQIAEPMRRHQGLSASQARTRAIELLDQVGVPDARRRIDAYPHQMSGGQRQRVTIAMALACNPDLLIADEPTTALDVTIQRQILDLIADLVDDRGMGLILISHDLGVIAENVDRMIVMYGGTAVEQGSTRQVFSNIGHPYTRGLFGARPKLGSERGTRLTTIAGVVPDLVDLPSSCTFAGRCAYTIDACRAAPPPVVEVAPSHGVRCIRVDDVMRAPVSPLQGNL